MIRTMDSDFRMVGCLLQDDKNSKWIQRAEKGGKVGEDGTSESLNTRESSLVLSLL